MPTEVAPFVKNVGGISLANFPPEVQDILAAFDTDGSGTIAPHELAMGANMYKGEPPHDSAIPTGRRLRSSARNILFTLTDRATSWVTDRKRPDFTQKNAMRVAFTFYTRFLASPRPDLTSSRVPAIPAPPSSRLEECR